MTDDNLPAAIAAFVDSTNAGDSQAFLAAFTDDAVLDDWGHTFHGRDGVARWNRTDNIGVEAHFDVIGVEPGGAPNTWVVELTVTGNGYNGTGPMTFTLDGTRIARLVIAG